jgi:dolichol-phosphate mannosyltransferase
VLADPAINLDQDWLNRWALEPYVLFKALRRHRVVEVPVTVRFHGPPTTSIPDRIREWARLIAPVIVLAARVRR